jgi:hypothetical protein
VHEHLQLEVVVDEGFHRVAPARAALVQEAQLVPGDGGDRAAGPLLPSLLLLLLLLEVKGRDRQIVQDHPYPVPLADPSGERLGALLVERRREALGDRPGLVAARRHGLRLDPDAQVVGRVLLAQAREQRSGVGGSRGAADALGRAAEGQGVVVERKLCLLREKRADLDWGVDERRIFLRRDVKIERERKRGRRTNADNASSPPRFSLPLFTLHVLSAPELSRISAGQVVCRCPGGAGESDDEGGDDCGEAR